MGTLEHTMIARAITTKIADDAGEITITHNEGIDAVLFDMAAALMRTNTNLSYLQLQDHSGGHVVVQRDGLAR